MCIIPELEPGEFGRAAANTDISRRDSTWPPSFNKKLGIESTWPVARCEHELKPGELGRAVANTDISGKDSTKNYAQINKNNSPVTAVGGTPLWHTGFLLKDGAELRHHVSYFSFDFFRANRFALCIELRLPPEGPGPQQAPQHSERRRRCPRSQWRHRHQHPT